MQEIEFIQNGLNSTTKKKDGLKLLIDFITSTITYAYTNNLEYIIKNIITEHSNLIPELPELIILISSYIIFKRGNTELDKNKLINLLIHGINFVHGRREFELIRVALRGLGRGNVEEPKSYKKNYSSYFLHMFFLQEAKVYCVEPVPFNK